jgi:hypothetical protein
MMNELGALASRILTQGADEYAWTNHLPMARWTMDAAAREFLYGRESSTLGRIALFSGRFDRPHIGHIIQIMRLGQRFSRVVVPVLDYPEQRYPVQYRVQILSEALAMARGNYSIVSNKCHFAKITREEALEFEFDVYVGGNIDCIRNMEQLGFETLFVSRAYDYSASAER